MTFHQFLTRHNLTPAQGAKVLNIHRTNAYQWLKRDPPAVGLRAMEFFDRLPVEVQREYLTQD